MASSIAPSSLLAAAGLPLLNDVQRNALSQRHTFPSNNVAVAPLLVAVNCAAAQETAPSSPSSSSSPALALPLLDVGSDGKLSISRRGAVLAGITALAGSGLNLIFTPTIGATEAKQTNLPIEDIKNIIEADIIERQYPVTGNLTESIYNDNCRFQDPTIDIQGVKKYTTALQLLFEPETSKHEILNIEVTGPRTIQIDWRLRGYIKLPWRPYIPPYEGTTTYTTDESGLIASHSETWKISPLTAFIQALTPSFLSKDAP